MDAQDDHQGTTVSCYSVPAEKLASWNNRHLQAQLNLSYREDVCFCPERLAECV